MQVNVSNADWQRMLEMFDKQHQWVLSQMQKLFREVNEMLADELKSTMERYKEYDGCYLGHYAQWFFWFFFTLGFFMFTDAIISVVGKHYGWF